MKRFARWIATCGILAGFATNHAEAQQPTTQVMTQSPEQFVMIDPNAGSNTFETYQSSNRGRLFFNFEAIWLKRTQSTETFLGQAQNPNTLDVTGTFSSGDFTSLYEPGAKLSLGKEIGDNLIAEVSFFGFNESRPRGGLGQVQQTNLEQSVSSPFLGVIIVNGAQAYEFNSIFYDLDVNLRTSIFRNSRRNVELVGGFRYFKDQESAMVVNGQFGFVDLQTGQATGQQGDERQESRVHNNVLGGHIDVDWNELVGPWTFTLHAGAGPYNNFSKVTTSHVLTRDGLISPNETAGTISDTDSKFTGIFTLGLRTKFNITQGVSFRAGYEAMIIPNMAFATDNLRTITQTRDAFDNIDSTTFAPGPFKQNGTMFLHGPTFGLEIIW